MRPQKAIRLVNKEMKKFYKISVIDYPDLSSLKCFLKRDVYKALKQLEQRYKHSLHEESIEYYKDATSVKDIMCSVHHISDRWKSYGRIRFLLRVLEQLK